ncbi:MAG: M64 family metallopeptidase [Spirochaetales bacterium]|nr:M64 family metallopeptidase [Spirochaetales bacterium]
MKRLLFMACVAALFSASCKLNTTTDQATYRLRNRMELFLGDDSEKGSRYNIGIVMDGLSDQQARQIAEQSFGNGDFSLFNTIPFNQHKNRFNVYIGTVESPDVNILPTVPQTLFQSVNFQQFLNAETSEDLAPFLAPIGQYLLGIPNSQLPQLLIDYKTEFTDNSDPANPEIPIPAYYYASILTVEGVLHNGGSLGTIGQRIQRNINSLKSPFSSYSFLDCKAIVSPGIGQGYADTTNDIMYCPLYNEANLYGFLGVLDESTVRQFHPDYTTATIVHEFGHIFADFADEYYAYNAGEQAEVFGITNPNTFRNGETNPWTSIANYDGTTFQGGSGGNSLRSSQNSIMRAYHKLRSPNDWKNKGWGPVHRHYILQKINAIN